MHERLVVLVPQTHLVSVPEPAELLAPFEQIVDECLHVGVAASLGPTGPKVGDADTALALVTLQETTPVSPGQRTTAT
jgi:hypothetical protein